MPHIQINNDQPGIVSLFIYNPETADALNNLAQILLRGNSTLKEYERELIASYVSYLNDCNFCFHSHAATVNALFGNDQLINQIKDVDNADISDKLKSLLKIAGKVQQNGKLVSEREIEIAKKLGANDKEIHDTVLIAAAFCMYNRYVDGLATVSSPNKEDYVQIGEMLATKGYLQAV